MIIPCCRGAAVTRQCSEPFLWKFRLICSSIAKLSLSMYCCLIWSFSDLSPTHSSILPCFHPASEHSIHVAGVKRCSALLCSPLLSAQNPFFGIWDMVHVSVHSSQNTNKWAWRWWCFSVVLCVSMFVRGWGRVQVITRIRAFAVPAPDNPLPRSRCLYPPATLLFYPYRAKSHHLHYNAPVTCLAFLLLLN